MFEAERDKVCMQQVLQVLGEREMSLRTTVAGRKIRSIPARQEELHLLHLGVSFEV